MSPAVPPLVRHHAYMARNNAWSNARLYRACLTLSNDEFAATRVSFFPSLQLTLNHILLVDRYYIDALVDGGAGPIFDNELPYPRAADLWPAQRESDRQLIAFCEALDSDDALRREVHIDRGPGIGITRETVGAVLPHLFVHQIHHRGQVHAMLAGTAVAPPQLDEFFLDFDAPSRARDLPEAAP